MAHTVAARVLDAASVPDTALGGTDGVDAYVAGPHALADACRGLLIDRGVSIEAISVGMAAYIGAAAVLALVPAMSGPSSLARA